MIRTYKRKLKLTKAQERRLLGWIGVCRLVHNMSLEIRKTAYTSNRPFIHKYELMKQLPDLRKGFDWIEDVPAQSLQAAVERLDRSYQAFFKGHCGFPMWANKKRYKSILFKTVNLDGNFLRLLKIGRLRMFSDAKVLGTPRTASIKVEPTGFFAYITCSNVPTKFNSENQTVGLDMGISNFCVTSSGDLIANPRHFAKYENQLRVESRSLARKKKGSNSWTKQAKRIALLHHKIGNVRKDFLHKESTKIAKENSKVFIEDLNIAGMVKNKNLSKHILDCGWGTFRTMLEYKTNVVRVDHKFTSQTCSECGHIDGDNRKSQANFKCVNCGHSDNADFNAAKNIKSKGIALVRQREPIGCALHLEPQSKGVSEKPSVSTQVTGG